MRRLSLSPAYCVFALTLVLISQSHVNAATEEEATEAQTEFLELANSSVYPNYFNEFNQCYDLDEFRAEMEARIAAIGSPSVPEFVPVEDLPTLLNSASDDLDDAFDLLFYVGVDDTPPGLLHYSQVDALAAGNAYATQNWTVAYQKYTSAAAYLEDVIYIQWHDLDPAISTAYNNIYAAETPIIDIEEYLAYEDDFAAAEDEVQAAVDLYDQYDALLVLNETAQNSEAAALLDWADYNLDAALGYVEGAEDHLDDAAGYKAAVDNATDWSTATGQLHNLYNEFYNIDSLLGPSGGVQNYLNEAEEALDEAAMILN